MFTGVELVIRHVAHGTPTNTYAIAQAVPWVAKEHGVDAYWTEFEGFFAQIAVHEPRAEFAYRNWKVHAIHLRTDGPLDGEIALIGTVDLDLVSSHIQRREERDRVDVVPVRMRYEDAGGEALGPRLHHVVR